MNITGWMDGPDIYTLVFNSQHYSNSASKLAALVGTVYKIYRQTLTALSTQYYVKMVIMIN